MYTSLINTLKMVEVVPDSDAEADSPVFILESTESRVLQRRIILGRKTTTMNQAYHQLWSGPQPMEIDDVSVVDSSFSCCCVVKTVDKFRPARHAAAAAATKPLVILDIDQTLVHSITYDEYMVYRTFNPERQPRVDFRLILKDGSDFVVRMRPGLDEFLRYVFANFRVAVWTAAQKEYADGILERIMTPEQLVRLAFLFTSRECAWSQKYKGPTKPAYRILQLIPDLDLSKTVLCDDNHVSTAEFAENTILVEPYNNLLPNADIDQEFERLSRYLERLFHPNHKQSDVRLRHAHSRGKRTWRDTVDVLN